MAVGRCSLFDYVLCGLRCVLRSSPQPALARVTRIS